MSQPEIDQKPSLVTGVAPSIQETAPPLSDPICPVIETEIASAPELSGEKPKVDAVVQPVRSLCACTTCVLFSEAKSVINEVQDIWTLVAKSVRPFLPSVAIMLWTMILVMSAVFVGVLIVDHSEIGRVSAEIVKMKEMSKKSAISETRISGDSNTYYKKHVVEQNLLTHPPVTVWFRSHSLNADGKQEINMYYTGNQKKVALLARCVSTIGPSYKWECTVVDEYHKDMKTNYNVVCAKDETGKILKTQCVFNYFSLEDRRCSWWGC